MSDKLWICSLFLIFSFLYGANIKRRVLSLKLLPKLREHGGYRFKSRTSPCSISALSYFSYCQTCWFAFKKNLGSILFYCYNDHFCHCSLVFTFLPYHVCFSLAFVFRVCMLIWVFFYLKSSIQTDSTSF